MLVRLVQRNPFLCLRSLRDWEHFQTTRKEKAERLHRVAKPADIRYDGKTFPPSQCSIPTLKSSHAAPGSMAKSDAVS